MKTDFLGPESSGDSWILVCLASLTSNLPTNVKHSIQTTPISIQLLNETFVKSQMLLIQEMVGQTVGN